MDDNDDSYGRLEDIRDSDQVDMIDENRAVIHVDGEEDEESYKLSVELEYEGGRKSNQFTGQSPESVFKKFKSWYYVELETYE